MNKEKQKLVPELRFPEFENEGEWDIKPLKKVFSIFQGYAFSSRDSVEKGTRWLKIADVSIQKMNHNNPSFLPDDYINIYKSFLIKKGDYVLALTRPILNGKLKISTVDEILHNSLLNQRVGKLVSNENLSLVYYLLQTHYLINEIEKSIAGSEPPNLSMKQIEDIAIPLSSNPTEQQKIANCLSSLDNLITAETEKLDQLKDHKKGLLQQLFPAKGETKPQFRFPEFVDDGDWVEKELKQLLKSYKLGGNYSNSVKQTGKPLIKMGNIGRGNIVLNKIQYIEETEVIDEDDKIKTGDLFLNTRNTLDLVGKVAIWRNEKPLAYYNSNLMRLEFNNNYFMNYRLNSNEGIKELKKYATGTTSVAAIYTKDLLKLKLSIPKNPKEQQKIANCLSSADDLIQSQTTKIKTLKKHKTGLMQQLFPQ